MDFDLSSASDIDERNEDLEREFRNMGGEFDEKKAKLDDDLKLQYKVIAMLEEEEKQKNEEIN